MAWEDAKPADAVVDQLLTTVVEDLGLEGGAGSQWLCGTMELELELNLIFGQALAWLLEPTVKPVRTLVGSSVASMNMNGVSVTIAKVNSETLELLNSPTIAPA